MSDLSPLSGVKRKSDFGDVRAAIGPETDIGSDAQIGIVTLPRAPITAHIRRANGRFVMLYPVVPSMNEARERNSKDVEARDLWKPLRRFRRHQSQNRGRHLSIDQPIDRLRLSPAQLDISRPRCRDRGPDTIVRRRMPVVYRNDFTGWIGYRRDFWTS